MKSLGGFLLAAVFAFVFSIAGFLCAVLAGNGSGLETGSGRLMAGIAWVSVEPVAAVVRMLSGLGDEDSENNVLVIIGTMFVFWTFAFYFLARWSAKAWRWWWA